ncbi:MAG TPA: hypothetical protein VKP30_27055, partial [Polyangiaceae bacterium]|nr:hypothetical protein [Polyangiaceae bacterium]
MIAHSSRALVGFSLFGLSLGVVNCTSSIAAEDAAADVTVPASAGGGSAIRTSTGASSHSPGGASTTGTSTIGTS